MSLYSQPYRPRALVITYLRIAGTGSAGKRAGRIQGSSADRTPSGRAGGGASESRRGSVRQPAASIATELELR
jgi:hypothetical protein